MIPMVTLSTAHSCVVVFFFLYQNVPMRLCESLHGGREQHESQCNPSLQKIFSQISHVLGQSQLTESRIGLLVCMKLLSYRNVSWWWWRIIELFCHCLLCERVCLHIYYDPIAILISNCWWSCLRVLQLHIVCCNSTNSWRLLSYTEQ